MFRSLPELRKAMRSRDVSPEFRERLMLAVTEVNRCRYCSYAHSKMAMQSGITQDEVKEILSHNLKSSPEVEIPAVLYAQSWAESDGHPGDESKQSLEKIYGAKKSEHIELILRTIWAANLAGNTLDYLLFRISFGRWGS
jgi:AhpD family alkylhydroperoxidase